MAVRMRTEGETRRMGSSRSDILNTARKSASNVKTEQASQTTIIIQLSQTSQQPFRHACIFRSPHACASPPRQLDVAPRSNRP